MFKYSDSEVKRLLEGVFNGTITDQELPVPLYYAIADYLRKGLYTGYGNTFSSLIKQVMTTGTEVTLKDVDLLAELRTNIYMFSAAKTYQQVKEMTSYLVNDDGTVTPFKQFREKAMATFELYNKTWLETEYNTAIGQAQNAAKWRQIEKDADVLPILQYDAVLDKNTSAICRPLDGLTAPVNDPIWKRIMPLNHFNCRCLVKQLTEGEAELTTDGKKNALYNESMDKMQDVFKMNAGQDGYIFKKDHPYFVVPKDDKNFAKKNFNLPIPKTDEPVKVAPKPAPAPAPTKGVELPKEFEQWGVKVDPRVKTLLEKPITAVEGTKGSFAEVQKNQITIDRGRRWKDSPLYGEKVIYHEVGHLVHEQKRLINFGIAVSDDYATHFKGLKKMVKDPHGIEAKMRSITLEAYGIKNDEDKAKFLGRYGCKNMNDLSELIGSTRDSLMALTNSRFGGGHTKSYMKITGAKEAEMFAHSMENIFSGNAIFKEVMPDVYDSSIEYIQKLLK